MTTGDRHATPDAASATGRGAEVAAPALAAFRQLLAPLRSLDMPNVPPATVVDLPRNPASR
jgi:hypothetical protein